jgi:hypothetical protein
VSDARKSQGDRILWVLQAGWPNWVPAPELAKISLQYNARIFSLRRRGWLIPNRVEVVDGVRHGFFRLGPRPVLSSKELRQRAGRSPITPVSGSLFGDLTPETARHRDDG